MMNIFQNILEISLNKLLLILPILFIGCTEVSNLKDNAVSLSCSVGETTYYDKNTLKTFKRQTNSSKSYRFPMEINKSKETINTTYMLGFENLVESELEYIAFKYHDDVVTNQLTIDRMSLKWKLHTLDTNKFNFAPANGEPAKQASIAYGQCYRANKI